VLLRPYFVLYRGRLIIAAVVALLVVIATVMMFGWNWCGCPPVADNG
jgi:hypothetical protein